MNAQTAFNTIWNWFIVKRGYPSSSLGTAQYRSKTGRCCALGLLIPDDLYFPEIESMGVAAFFEERNDMYVQQGEKWSRLRAHLIGIGKPLLIDLQDSHDDLSHLGSNRHFTAAMREDLLDIAAEHDLVVPS